MEVLAYASAAYLAFRLFVAFTNLITRSFLQRGKPVSLPFVSILIPARNEEGNIGALLSDLKLIDYPHFEILVYDDDSDDNTDQIIHEAESRNNRIRYFRGNGPDQGWLGKNYACDQLARQAAGDYLLFMDADVRVSPDLVNDSLAFMKKHDLSLFSIFPEQIMKSFGEWLTVPLMNRILVGNLPLILVRKSKWVDFAAANGQFMMFNAETYKKHWFHERFKDERVEDIRIIRLMKALKYPVHTLLSGGQVRCRMYQGYREGLTGFSKNIHAFFGKNWIILFLFNLLATFGPIAVWLAFSLKLMLVYFSALVLFSILVSVQSRQTIWKNILFMPFQQFSVVVISILAAYQQITGKISWKGRRI